LWHSQVSYSGSKQPKHEKLFIGSKSRITPLQFTMIWCKCMLSFYLSFCLIWTRSLLPFSPSLFIIVALNDIVFLNLTPSINEPRIQLLFCQFVREHFQNIIVLINLLSQRCACIRLGQGTQKERVIYSN